MNYRLIPDALRPVAEKIEAQERVSDAEAVALYQSRDLNALGMMANVVRERKNGNYASYIHNRYINYSNICILSCQFCAFAARKRDPHAFEFAIEEIVRVVREALPLGITEVHMVGGLHPTLRKEWYLDLLRELRALDPDLHIKAFTAIEVRHLAQRIFRLSIREMLELLREHGLGSITGGGAEIFDPAVRDAICRGKETAEEWLEVHRTWHEMGGRSTCTMLYGHIETLEHRVDHLSKYWVSIGLPLAQVSLSYGVDDLHGTILEEKIFHMAGATTPQQQTVAALEHAIREAGRDPVQRDSHYRRVTPSKNGSMPGVRSAEAELTCV